MRDDAGRTLRKASQVVVVLVVACVAIILFWLWTSWHFVNSTIKYVVENLASHSGISTNLLYGIVIIATIPFFWAVTKCMHAMWLWQLGPGPGLRLYKSIYGVIIVVYVGVFFLAMYFVSRDSLAYKYCAATPEGIKTYDDAVKDPVYGVQAQPCTLDQIVEIRRADHPGMGPQRVQVGDARTFEFFDPITGHPRVWYFKDSNGEYKFFNQTGYDPGTHEPLREMDRQTREDVIRLQEQRAAAPQLAEQQRVEQARLATDRRAEEERRATARADTERRQSYMLPRSLASKVEFVVSAE